MKNAFRIATYNIEHAAAGEKNVAAVLRELNAGVVGIQEVDLCNSRSGGRDQPALLADLSGMPYYRFAPAIDFRGGAYGTLILSRYPVASFEVVPLDAEGYEGRSVGHAVLDIEGTRVDFFNTHLSYENSGVRARQFGALAELLKPCRRFILTGDFNVEDLDEYAVLGAAVAINRKERVIGSFIANDAPIDNVLLSAGFAEIAAGRLPAVASDHYPVWAEVKLTP